MNARVKKAATLGERLKQAYVYRGLSQHQLEAAIGVSQGTVSRYVSTDPQARRSPSAAHLTAIGRVLGVSLDWLVDGIGGPDYVEPWSPPSNAKATPSRPRTTHVESGIRTTIKNPDEDRYQNRQLALIAIRDHFDPRTCRWLMQLSGGKYEDYSVEDWANEAELIEGKIRDFDAKYKRKAEDQD